MNYQVVFQTLAPRPVAVLRFQAAQSELPRKIPWACGEVWNFLRAAQVKTAGRHVAVYHDREINVECGAEVDEPFISDGRVVASSTPAGRVATATHIGPYHLLGGAHQAITQACKAQGHCMAGPNWEIYGHWIDDATPPRTDVFYLLK